MGTGASGCATVQPDPTAALKGVVPVERWGGTPSPVPDVARPITHITLHHQGEVWDPAGDVPAYLRRLQDWSRQARGWADIPYHWIVAPDGTVYAARPWQRAGDTNTEYDPRGHLLVMLLGNFEVQQPTAAQWDAAVAVVAGLQRGFGLPDERIATHRDHSGQTVCPGANFMVRLEEFRRAVKGSGR